MQHTAPALRGERRKVDSTEGVKNNTAYHKVQCCLCLVPDGLHHYFDQGRCGASVSNGSRGCQCDEGREDEEDWKKRSRQVSVSLSLFLSHSLTNILLSL